VEVLHDDLQALSDFRRKYWTCQDSLENCVGDEFYARYQPLSIIYARMDQNIERSNGFMRPVMMGFSHEQRPIRGYTLTSPTGGNKRAALYHCAIHSREWITVPFCMWLGETLLGNYETDPVVRRILDNYVIHIFPVMNVDGYLWTHSDFAMWRKNRKPNTNNNCIGTDLNRNFPFQWGTGGSSNNPCSDTFMGERPLDNAETVALNNYVGMANPPFSIYMDIHASGLMWMFPYGYLPTSACPGNPRACGVAEDAVYNDQMACGQASSDAIFAVHGNRFRVGPITFIIYQASGSTVDQMYGNRGIKYAYCPEVRAGFQPDPSHIIPSNQELYARVRVQLDFDLKRQ